MQCPGPLKDNLFSFKMIEQKFVNRCPRSFAYLKRVFSLEIAWRSLFITAYNTWPIPDPWTTLRPMLLVFDR